MIGDPVDARTLEFTSGKKAVKIAVKKIRLGKRGPDPRDPPPGSVTDLADNSTELPAKRQRAEVQEGNIGKMHLSAKTGSTAESTVVVSDHDYTDRFENVDEQHR